MRARLLLFSALTASLVVATPTQAVRTIRRSCHDGVPFDTIPARRPCNVSTSCPICDGDYVCDGECTFFLTYCADPCRPVAVVVPVGEKIKMDTMVACRGRKGRRGLQCPARVILRCRRPGKAVPCITTTVTTSSTTTTSSTLPVAALGGLLAPG